VVGTDVGESKKHNLSYRKKGRDTGYDNHVQQMEGRGTGSSRPKMNMEKGN